MPAQAYVIPYQPHSGGQIAFHSARDKRNRALACGSRWGKDRCTVNELWAFASQLAAMKLRMASAFRMCVPLVHVWVVAPDYPRQKQFWRELNHFIPEAAIVKSHDGDYILECSITSDKRPQILIELKSARDPKGLVSVGLDLLVLTEAALVKDEAWNYYLLPRLISPGRSGCVIANGTPKGRNWFWKFWLKCNADPVNGWAIQAPSWDNPFIDRQWIEEMETEMPPLAYRQEIKAEFVSASGGVFADPREATKLHFQFTAPVVVGIDLGKVHDASVFLALCASGQMVGMERVVGVKYTEQKPYLDNIIDGLLSAGVAAEDIVLAPERNSVGEVVCELLEQWYPGMVHKPLYQTNPSKRLIIDELALDLEQQRVALLDEPQLLNELELFEYVMMSGGRMRFGNPEGAHNYDDCVMALAIANHTRHEVNTWGHRPKQKWRVGQV